MKRSVARIDEKKKTKKEWSWQELNSRQSPCEDAALPLSYNPVRMVKDGRKGEFKFQTVKTWALKILEIYLNLREQVGRTNRIENSNGQHRKAKRDLQTGRR